MCPSASTSTWKRGRVRNSLKNNKLFSLVLHLHCFYFINYLAYIPHVRVILFKRIFIRDLMMTTLTYFWFLPHLFQKKLNLFIFVFKCFSLYLLHIGNISFKPIFKKKKIICKYIYRYEQLLLSHSDFKRLVSQGTSKGVIVWEWVKTNVG